MKCTRAQALIASASFMDWPRDELDAAQRHAQGCETCRPLLATEMDFVADLQALSTPVEAPDLSAAVLVRIAAAGSRSVEAKPHGGSEMTWWWLPVAAAVVIVLLPGLWGSRSVATSIQHLLIGKPSHGLVQSAVSLVNIALYLIVLFVPLSARRERA
jgi:hypothetical protein